MAARGGNRFGLAAVLFLSLVWLGPVSARADGETLALPVETLVITRTSGAPLSLTVEVADDDSERERGLMGRDSLPPGSGMLFDFNKTRPVQMWMKDTKVPLDMLFIDRNGRITHIRQNAEPMSLDIIDSRGSVRFVLELGGGEVTRLGIAKGDRADSATIGRAGE